ncbi:MAG: PqqD family protein [Xanthomonadales bacterium]|nr:hypothetical protein [Xanthomonadales bacterium]MCC6593907.1 PqqD family protein [Xanthomonadales bacterium]MCE7932046.1 PqqD family protein [Xanthomonadales bacterium PRO6]
MPLQLQDRFAPSQTQLSTTVDGATVVLDLERGCYYSLRQVAATIWSLLEQPRTLDELLRELRERYAVDPAVCRADTEELLAQLLGRGLIVREPVAP